MEVGDGLGFGGRWARYWRRGDELRPWGSRGVKRGVGGRAQVTGRLGKGPLMVDGLGASGAGCGLGGLWPVQRAGCLARWPVGCRSRRLGAVDWLDVLGSGWKHLPWLAGAPSCRVWTLPCRVSPFPSHPT